MERLYNATYTQTRSTKTAADAGRTTTTISTGGCYIEPVTDKSKIYEENNIGKEYRLFTKSTSDIQPSDTFVIVTNEGGRFDGSYNVSQFANFSDVISRNNSHIQIRLTK